MANAKKRALLWSAAGLLLSLLVLLVVSSGLAGKVLVTEPDGIAKTTDSVLTCIRNGAWEDLELLISGASDLDIATGEEDTAENLIWSAYQQSLQWSCEEHYDIQGPHVAQRVTVTCLDISAVTDAMAQILHGLSDPHDRDLALRAAAQQVLDTDPPTIQRTITLTYVRKDNRWQMIPNSALLALLSGFTAS